MTENIAKIKLPNIAYPNQHIDIEIPHCSRDHAIVSNTVKTTFNFDIESTDKTSSIVKNVVRALVNKNVLMFGSKEIDTVNNKNVLMFGSKEIDIVNNGNIYDTYKDLYFSNKEREEKLLQGKQLANNFKA